MRLGSFFQLGLIALSLAACGGEDGAKSVVSTPGGSASAPSPAPAPAPAAPTPAPDTTPGPTPTSAPAAGDAPTGELPPLDLSNMRLWNYDAKWHPSHWDNAFGVMQWKYDHVIPRTDGAVDFELDMFGAPELKATNGIAARTSGTWEVDVTLPELRDGLVVAPLWLFNQKAREEIDFEFAGRKGLDLTIHAYPGGVHHTRTVRVLKGQDLSGRRMRLAIKADIPAGWTEMYVDGKLMHRFEREELGYFITQTTRPVISMWAADPMDSGFNQWLGRWTGIAPEDTITMTVHGYRYTPLEG